MSNVNWEQIREEWETSNITLKDLAEKHGVKESTMRSRKNREKWQRNATQRKKATQRKNVATRKELIKNGKDPVTGQFLKGNKIAEGNRGNPNPKNKFTERNSAARKHGLFSRYMPRETLEIIEQLGSKTPADMLWDQILIQYANLIRSQEIMFVESKDELIKELKREKQQSGEKGAMWEEEYELRFAWDRQAQLLQAQARAISELRTSINQFLRLADEEDERRLKLEQMRLNIDKTKIEIDKLSEGGQDGPIEIQIVSAKPREQD